MRSHDAAAMQEVREGWRAVGKQGHLLRLPGSPA